jgi:hypothetical protein
VFGCSGVQVLLKNSKISFAELSRKRVRDRLFGRFKDSKIQRFKDSKIQRLASLSSPDSYRDRFKDSKDSRPLARVKDSKIQRFKNSVITIHINVYLSII